MRRKLEVQLTSDVPGELVVGQVDLDPHDHVDELVARREPPVLDAGRVGWILVLRIGADKGGAGALEIAEGGASPCIEQGLDRSVRVLWRVMYLRDVVHRRDAVVELRKPAE